MWESLKGLSSSGLKVAPVVTPAPAAEPTPVVVNEASVASLHADPYSDARRFDNPSVKPVAIPMPAPAASAPVDAPVAGVKALFDESGVLCGHLHADGKFVAVTIATPLDHHSEADRRPIDWDEEKRTDLPQRSSGRIQFLLQHETAAQTQDRIQNDIARYHFGGGDGRALRANPQGLQRNPEAATSAAGYWHK
jgi:hypothetical protein